MRKNIINSINKAQWFYVALVVVALVFSIWFYRFLRKQKAKKIEIDDIITKYNVANAQDAILTEEFEVTNQEVVLARDVALQVSILFEKNSELSFWEKNSDNLLFISQLFMGTNGVWDSNIEEAKNQLNRIRNQKTATLVQTFYDDFTSGNNLKIDIDKFIPIKSTREIKIYKYLN